MKQVCICPITGQISKLIETVHEETEYFNFVGRHSMKSHTYAHLTKETMDQGLKETRRPRSNEIETLNKETFKTETNRNYGAEKPQHVNQNLQ